MLSPEEIKKLQGGLSLMYSENRDWWYLEGYRDGLLGFSLEDQGWRDRTEQQAYAMGHEDALGDLKLREQS